MNGAGTGSVLWPESVARIKAQNGAAHHLVKIAPADTALVVVDMQNFYLREESTNFCPPALDIVSNINRLAGAVRDAGSPVIWLRNILSNTDVKNWSSFYGRMSEERLAYRKQELAKDGAGFKLWEGLDIRSSDRKINKTRFSAFTPGASNIEKILGEHGVETLIVCGIVTNVCVESTVRDAMMLNYDVLVAEDACAASTPRVHEASINAMYTHFADVQTTDQIVATLKGEEWAEDATANAAE